MVGKINANHITLATAVMLSGIAGWFSVVGLATIFSGAFWSVVIMASALELSKVVSVSWLSQNWDNAPRMIKRYLCVSVGVLMLITSMGTFGYLSKAHMAVNDKVEMQQLNIQPLQTQLDNENRKLYNAQTSLNTLDKIVNTVDPTKATRVRRQQQAERTSINKEIEDTTANIQKINTQLLPLKQQVSVTESDVGPLKYVSELIYGNSAKDHFDSAVRIVIMIIVLVFDPLAIAMLIAANHGLGPTSRFKFDKATGKLVYNK